MVLSRSEISKRYDDKNKDKKKANRKKIDVECPTCKKTRSIRADSKRITDLCNLCSIRRIRTENGDILHGLSKHPLYIRWSGMKQRVKDPLKRNSYLDKNVIVCDEWSNNFLLFYEWSLSNGFKTELELDRIDNNGDYSPNNCRWITHIENCANK